MSTIPYHAPFYGHATKRARDHIPMASVNRRPIMISRDLEEIEISQGPIKPIKKSEENI